MDDFYSETLRRLLNDGWMGLDSSVLVVCGAGYDRDVFHGLGFRRVTISNLDSRLASRIDRSEFAPYPWSLQDVESLGFEDGAFDFVVVHQGLHHCHSPHRGLLEMYRVARVGVLAFEPRDTRLVRLGVKLGFGQEYEIAAVAGNGLRRAGWAIALHQTLSIDGRSERSRRQFGRSVRQESGVSVLLCPARAEGAYAVDEEPAGVWVFAGVVAGSAVVFEGISGAE